jgi:DNA repair exonuclease SbcCD ATPase subunit
VSAVSEVEALLVSAERRIERRVGEAKALAAQGQRAKEQAEQAQATVVACEQAVAFLNSFADERQEKVQRRIEELVTHGVQTIFGDDMTFHVISEQKANRSEVTFSLRSTMGDQVVETPILDARGGGVAAVVGFLLRLIVTLLREERPLLVLDETFAQLSAEYEPRLAEFLRELVDQTGVQIVMVTHSEAFSEHADKVYRFGQKKGVTTVALEGGTDTADD